MEKRGGKRAGAGRKKLAYKTRQIKITIPESMMSDFKLLGGSRWVQSKIKEESNVRTSGTSKAS